MIALFIVFILVIIGLVGALVISQVDWRAFFMRRYGNDYRRGEAVFTTNGVRTYFISELWHEGPTSMSYWRKTTLNGKTVIYDDIVPNPPPGVPMQYDANGRRMYWPQLGGVVCSNTEVGGYQFTNYAPELLSSEMFDRVGVKYGTSVKDGGGNGMLIIIGIAVVVLVVLVLLFTAGPLKPRVVQQPTANVTAPAPAPSAPGTIQGVPIPMGGQ